MTIEINANTRAPAPPERDVANALWRGAARRCPACGNAALFRAYLKVADTCPACNEALHHHRADDAPPYFTILIVGHVLVGGVLSLERAFQPSMLVHLAIWIPLTVLLSLLLLPPVKGALVGLQWALRMHGFGTGRDPAAPDALPEQPRPGP